MFTAALSLRGVLALNGGFRMKVVVVGAGLSGLAAAYRLQQAGVDVEVLEADERPGGRCHVLRTHGFIVDLCPEISAASYERYFGLARAAGLGDDIVPCSAVVASLRDGRMVDIDTRSLASLVFTPLLSWTAKLRLTWGLLRNIGLIRRANAFKLGDLAALDDPAISAGDFAVRAFGREAANYLIDPLMRTLGGSQMGQVSQLTALGGINSWATSLLTIRGGLYRLPENIAAKLPVRYRASVTHVAEHGAGVELRYGDALGTSHVLHADHCIVTAPLDDAVRIFPGLAKYAGDACRHLKFVKLIDLKLGYTAATKSRAYMAQCATHESPDLMMFALVHNKAPDRAPPGHSLFTIYSDHAVWDRFAAMSDEEIIAWGRERIERWYPELQGHFLFGHVGREPRTAYFATPGFYRHTTKLFAALAPSRVQLAGDLFGAGSMEAAVVWGEKAADRVLSKIEATPPLAAERKAA